MKLEDVRLLIIVEQADYREYLADVWSIPLTDQPPDGLSLADLHILRAAADWRSQAQEVAIFSTHSAENYSSITPLGVRLMGSGVASSDQSSQKSMVRLVADFCPTHIVLCTPALAILRWANRNRILSIALFSDWQEPLGWRARWQHAQLIKQLNHSSVNWVGSHGVAACKILAASGISPSKLIPWEWPQPQPAQQYLPKQLSYDQDTLELIYAGSIHEAAGVSDLLLALSLMHKQGNSVRLKLVYETADKEKQTQATLTPEAMPSELTEDTLMRNSAWKDDMFSRLLAGESLQFEAIDDNLRGELASRATPQRANLLPPHSSLSHLNYQGGNASASELAFTSELDSSELDSSELDSSELDSSELDSSELDSDLLTLQAQVYQLNLSEYVTFMAAPSAEQLLEDIRAADLMVIPGYNPPSPSYDWPPPASLGRPIQSIYLAMAARTPIVASNHPCFEEHLFHGVNAMIFPTGNARSMVHRIERLMSQPQLYAQISEALEIALHTLKVPVQWAELIDYWINSGSNMPAGTDNHQRLCNWAFSSGRYHSIASSQKQF